MTIRILNGSAVTQPEPGIYCAQYSMRSASALEADKAGAARNSYLSKDGEQRWPRGHLKHSPMKNGS